jgi:hypothetical protein
MDEFLRLEELAFEVQEGLLAQDEVFAGIRDLPCLGCCSFLDSAESAPRHYLLPCFIGLMIFTLIMLLRRNIKTSCNCNNHPNT